MTNFNQSVKQFSREGVTDRQTESNLDELKERLRLLIRNPWLGAIVS